MSASATLVGGASGNNSDHRVRVAGQDCVDIDDFPTMNDGRDNGTGFGYTQGSIAPLKIEAGGAPAKQLDGKTPLDPFTVLAGDVDPGDILQNALMANVFGEFNVATAASRSRWRFGLAEGTDADPLLKFLVHDGVNPTMRILNGVLQGFDLSATANSNFALSFPGAATRYDFFETPAQTVGAASTLPTLLGVLPDETFDAAEAAPDSVFLEVQSITSGVVVLKATIATAASTPGFAGSNTFSVVAGGNPARATDEATGLYLGGDPGNPIEVSFPASPTLTATDVFEIETRRDIFTPSLAANRSISSRNVEMLVNDLPVRFEGGFSVSARWSTFGARPDVPGSQGGRVSRAGTLQVTLTVTREVYDLVFAKLRLSRDKVPVVINAPHKTLIPSSAFPYRAGLVLPAVAVSGASFRSAPGGSGTTEVATMIAEVPDSGYSYDGRTWASHCHYFTDTGITGF